jgi:hypothetical protein
VKILNFSRKMVHIPKWKFLGVTPAIFADGAPDPPVTSFVASKSFCRPVDAINTHDMTLAGDASFNGGIFLMAAAVDRALKGSMAGGSMNKSFE